MKTGSPLSRFFDAVNTDPLFAAEGLDLAYGRSSLKRLSSVLSKLEEVMARNSFFLRLFFIRYPLRRFAVPMTFLQSLFDSEEARRNFLVHPTEKTASDLLSSWDKAQQALIQNIHRYQLLHKIAYRIERPSSSVFYDIFGNPFSIEHTNTTLHLIEKNAYALQREIGEYANLLKGTAVSKARKIQNNPPLPPLTNASLLPWQERLHSLVAEHTVPFRTAKIVEGYGPISYTLSYLNGTPTPRLFFVYILEGRGSRERFFHIALADEFYFLPLNTKSYSSGSSGVPHAPLAHGVYTALHAPLLKAGITYWYHPAAQLYVTRDVTYWADLATMVDRIRRPDLRSDLLEAQRSSLFDLILSACVEDVHYFKEQTSVRVHMTGKPMPLPYLHAILTRTHPGIFYLPFNASVWRLAEHPNFLGTGRLKPEERLYKPSAEVLPDLSPEMLQQMFRGQRMRREAWLQEGIPGVRRESEF